MNKFLVVLALGLVFFVSASQRVSAEEKQIKVEATGSSFEEAEKNALMRAVEQVVGSYLSTDTVVKNGAVIKNEILNYSAGYVSKYKVLEKKQVADHSWKVKILATVANEKVVRKLKEMNLTTIDVEGKSLFGEAFTKIEEKKSSMSLLDKTLRKFPDGAYIISISKPQIISTNASSGKATIALSSKITFDKDWIGELKESLRQVAKKSFSVKSSKKDNPDSNRKKSNRKKSKWKKLFKKIASSAIGPRGVPNQSKADKGNGIAFTDTVHVKSGSATDFYLINDTETMSFVHNKLDRGKLKYLSNGRGLFMIVYKFIDSSGSILKSYPVLVKLGEFPCPLDERQDYLFCDSEAGHNGFFHYAHAWGLCTWYSNLGVRQINEVYFPSSYHPNRGIGFWTDIDIPYRVEFQVNIETLKKTTKIEANITFADRD